MDKLLRYKVRRRRRFFCGKEDIEKHSQKSQNDDDQYTEHDQDQALILLAGCACRTFGVR